MTSNNACDKVKRSGLNSVLLFLAGWLVLMFGGAMDAVIPSWLSWQVGFMVMLPLGVVGVLYSVARAFQVKTCF